MCWFFNPVRGVAQFSINVWRVKILFDEVGKRCKFWQSDENRKTTIAKSKLFLQLKAENLLIVLQFLQAKPTVELLLSSRQYLEITKLNRAHGGKPEGNVSLRAKH